MFKVLRLRSLLCVILLCVLLTSCGTQGVMSQFSTTDLDGNEVDQSLLASAKLTLVHIWTTDCSPARTEMPILAQLADEFADQEIQILGLVPDTVSSDWSPESAQVALARSIVEEASANYRQLLPCASFSAFLKQIYSVPTSFFVDANGSQVGSVYVGSRDHDEWAEIIAETLALLP